MGQGLSLIRKKKDTQNSVCLAGATRLEGSNSPTLRQVEGSVESLQIFFVAVERTGTYRFAESVGLLQRDRGSSFSCLPIVHVKLTTELALLGAWLLARQSLILRDKHNIFGSI
jgi:hypothetical protein